MVGHHLDGFVGRQKSMLNAVDSGADTSADGAIADGVGGDPDPGTMRFVGDGSELGIGVLLRPRCRAVRHYAAGCRYLDDLGAVANLVAHTGDNLGHTVSDPFGHGQRHDARRKSLKNRRVQVPAVRRDGMPGRLRYEGQRASPGR